MEYRRIGIEEVVPELAAGKYDCDSLEALEHLIEKIEKMTASEHAGDHQFENDPNRPGVCRVCGHVSANVLAPCGCHTLVEALRELLGALKMAANLFHRPYFVYVVRELPSVGLVILPPGIYGLPLCF